MSYQQQQKTPFCALTMKMYATGKKAPSLNLKLVLIVYLLVA